MKKHTVIYNNTKSTKRRCLFQSQIKITNYGLNACCGTTCKCGVDFVIRLYCKTYSKYHNWDPDQTCCITPLCVAWLTSKSNK